MLAVEPCPDMSPFAVERFACTEADKIAVLGATPSVEYIVPPTIASVKSVIPAPVLFNPTSPEIVPVPVIAVCAITEKDSAAPKPGSVAACVVVGAATPNSSAIPSIVAENLLVFCIDIYSVNYIKRCIFTRDDINP